MLYTEKRIGSMIGEDSISLHKVRCLLHKTFFKDLLSLISCFLCSLNLSSYSMKGVPWTKLDFVVGYMETVLASTVAVALPRIAFARIFLGPLDCYRSK